MTPVSEHLKEEVWQNLYDANRLVRYYAAVSKKYQNWHIGTRIVLYVFATSGIATLVEAIPPVAGLVLGGVLAVTLTVDLVFDFGKKATVSASISVQCAHLRDEWENLWNEVRNETQLSEMRNLPSYR